MEQLILENQILIMQVLQRMPNTSEDQIKQLNDQINFTKARINASR